MFSITIIYHRINSHVWGSIQLYYIDCTREALQDRIQLNLIMGCELLQYQISCRYPHIPNKCQDNDRQDIMCKNSESIPGTVKFVKLIK